MTNSASKRGMGASKAMRSLVVESSMARIGEEISRLRRNRKLRQQDLAQRVGCGTHTIRRLEAGHNTTTIWEVLHALDRKLLTNIEMLIQQSARGHADWIEEPRRIRHRRGY